MFCHRIIIYLCFHTALDSDSLLLFPLPIFRFLTCGVYQRFTFQFPKNSSLWHLKDRDLIRRLRFWPAVRDSSLPSVIFSASTNTTSIAASVSMDFPLTNKICQQLPGSTILFSWGHGRDSTNTFHRLQCV